MGQRDILTKIYWVPQEAFFLQGYLLITCLCFLQGTSLTCVCGSYKIVTDHRVNPVGMSTNTTFDIC
jgi:hypothetical protein